MNKKSFFEEQIILFFTFLHRDFIVYKAKAYHSFFNYLILRPVSIVLLYGYLMPLAGIIQSKYVPILVVGGVLTSMSPSSFVVGQDLLVDLSYNKHLCFQAKAGLWWVIIFEKIIFSSLYSFMYSIMFFPIAKIVLGFRFDISMLQMSTFVFIVYLGSLFYAAFNILFAVLVPSIDIYHYYYMLINYPINKLGGGIVPLYIATFYSPYLGTFLLFNPVTYTTEGLRRVLTNSSDYLSISICITMLIILSGITSLLAIYFFKQKLNRN